MCITLNQKEEFDLETLDFIKKNPTSFNYIKSEGIIVPPEHRYYQVLHDRSFVGFIILIKIIDELIYDEKDNAYELEIGIFDNFKDKSYASKAISKLLNELKHENTFIIEAIIKNSNSNLIKMKTLLISKGFTHNDIYPKNQLVYRIVL